MAKVYQELLQYLKKKKKYLKEYTVKLHSEALVGALFALFKCLTEIFVACVQET